nr:2-amino-4-hydroxy-6-hydroxymethyldihydropteridine diphosphokinase [Desulfovibrio sp.]
MPENSSGKGLQAYVCLGSNCANAEEMLARARQGLAALPHIRTGAASPLYCTEPQGYADQSWFFNQVIELFADASWTPCSLVDALLDIEADLGRVRSADPALRFGPRAIDADLLLFGQMRSQDPHCLVPHPRLTQRAFALVPLLDVAPHAVIDGLPATEWLSRLQYKKDGQRIFQ